MSLLHGRLRKMGVEPTRPVSYTLRIGDDELPLADRLGQSLKLSFDGEIRCGHCQKRTKKSYGQGHCYPCFARLAQCDRCIVRPELCHYHAGTCREPEWGQAHCFQPHTVYLANSSGVKVGITRHHQQQTRWMDQGATQALPIRVVTSRLDSGRLEDRLREFVSDRTDWRRMLRGDAEPIDLAAIRDDLAAKPGEPWPGEPDADAHVHTFEYPVLTHPKKIKSLTLDRAPLIEGTLEGIKGQYLIFDIGVFNVRRHAGYVVEVD